MLGHKISQTKFKRQKSQKVFFLTTIVRNQTSIIEGKLENSEICGNQPRPEQLLIKEEIKREIKISWEKKGRKHSISNLMACNKSKCKREVLCACMLHSFSHVQLFATLQTVACQAPLSMGFSRKEFWSGLPCPPPGYLPNPGIEPTSLASPELQADSLPTELPAKPGYSEMPTLIKRDISNNLTLHLMELE